MSQKAPAQPPNQAETSDASQTKGSRKHHQSRSDDHVEGLQQDKQRKPTDYSEIDDLAELFELDDHEKSNNNEKDIDIFSPMVSDAQILGDDSDCIFLGFMKDTEVNDGLMFDEDIVHVPKSQHVTGKSLLKTTQGKLMSLKS